MVAVQVLLVNTVRYCIRKSILRQRHVRLYWPTAKTTFSSLLLSVTMAYSSLLNESLEVLSYIGRKFHLLFIFAVMVVVPLQVLYTLLSLVIKGDEYVPSGVDTTLFWINWGTIQDGVLVANHNIQEEPLNKLSRTRVYFTSCLTFFKNIALQDWIQVQATSPKSSKCITLHQGVPIYVGILYSPWGSWPIIMSWYNVLSVLGTTFFMPRNTTLID